MSGDELIKLPVIRACIEKWTAGRAKHGDTFQGDPLVELHGELLDAINYCDQFELGGGYINSLRARLLDMVREVRVMHLRRSEQGDE